MGGTSATGVKAVGKRTFKLIQKKAKSIKFKSQRHRRIWMQRAARNVAWAQKNSKFIKGKGAGRSAAQEMIKTLGASGYVARSRVLNKAGVAAMKGGKLNMVSGAAGKDPLATGVSGVVLPRRGIPAATPRTQTGKRREKATPAPGPGGRFQRGPVR